MMKVNHKFFRILIYLLILSGVVGTVLFFPINLGNEHTCLYHRIFSKENGIHPSTPRYSSISGSNNQVSQDRSQEHLVQQKQLLDKYVIPYGLSWWGSLGLVGIGLLVIRWLNKITSPSNWNV